MRVVASPQFEKLWVSANRAAHKQLLRLLEGPPSPANSRQITLGTVQVNLPQVVAAVRTRLMKAGLQPVLTSGHAAINARVTLYQSKGVEKLRTLFNVLKALGIWTPIVSISLLVGAFFLSDNRRRTAKVSGLWIILSVILVAVLGDIIQTAYLNAVKPNLVPPRAAAAAFSVLVRFLKQYYVQLASLGLILFIVGLYLGPSRLAIGTRYFVQRMSASAGNWLEEKHVCSAGVRNFFLRYAKLLRLLILAGSVLLAFLVGGWLGELLAVLVALFTLAVVEIARMPKGVEPTAAQIRPAHEVSVSSS